MPRHELHVIRRTLAGRLRDQAAKSVIAVVFHALRACRSYAGEFARPGHLPEDLHSLVLVPVGPARDLQTATRSCICHTDSLLWQAQGASVRGAVTSMCIWLGSDRGCHSSSGAASVATPANSSFGSELVTYTACYQKVTSSQCSDSMGMCTWSSADSGKARSVALGTAVIALLYPVAIHFHIVLWRPGCTSVLASHDFAAAAAQCASTASNSTLCTLLQALISPTSICYSMQDAAACLGTRGQGDCELSPFTNVCQPGAGLALAQLAGGSLAAQVRALQTVLQMYGGLHVGFPGAAVTTVTSGSGRRTTPMCLASSQ